MSIMINLNKVIFLYLGIIYIITLRICKVQTRIERQPTDVIINFDLIEETFDLDSKRRKINPVHLTEAIDLEFFNEELQSVRTYHDLMKIFYGQDRTYHDVDRMLAIGFRSAPPNRGRSAFYATFAPRSNQDMFRDLKSANEHFLRIRKDGFCKQPKPKVINVKDYYPSPSILFLPRCTIVHRCASDLGCCDHEGYQCMAKEIDEVLLPFYTLELKRPGTHVQLTPSQSVKYLKFINHTKCECRSINDHLRINGIHDRNFNSRCKQCPYPFSLRQDIDLGCSCDCFDKDRPCLRVKRGKEFLDEAELICVIDGRCHPPDCQFGEFDFNASRCPREDEFVESSTGEDEIEIKIKSTSRQRRYRT